MLNLSMWSWILLFAVALPSTYVQAQDIVFCSALLTTEGKVEITYSYDSATNFPNRPRPLVKVTDGTRDLSLLYTINSEIDGGVIADYFCAADTRVCGADIGLLDDPVIRNHFFGVSDGIDVRLAILYNESDTTPMSCYVVGRELSIAEHDMDVVLVESDEMTGDPAFSFNTGVGPANSGAALGLTAIPESISTWRTDGSNELRGIMIHFDDASTQLFGDSEVIANNKLTDLVDFAFDASAVATIEISYSGNNVSNSTTNPRVCNIQFLDSLGDPLLSGSQIACIGDSSVVTYTIDEGYTFAGFAGMNAVNRIQFTLNPLEYVKVQPLIFYYESESDSSITAYLNSFFTLTDPFTVNYKYQDGINAEKDGLNSVSDSAEIASGSSGKLLVEIPSECGCTEIDIFYDPAFDEADFSQDNVETRAWNSAIVDDGMPQTWGTVTVDVDTEAYSTGSKYWTTVDDLDSAECTMMRPKTYLTDFVDGVPYIDGLMGSVDPLNTEIADPLDLQSFVDPQDTSRYLRIDSVRVHTSGGALVGLTLSEGNTDVEIGITNGVILSDTLQPDDADDADKYLLYLTFYQDQSGTFPIVGVEAHFGATAPPCFIVSEAVADDNGFQTIFPSDNLMGINADMDADLYRFYMYMPNDFAQIWAELTGYFLTFHQTETYYLELLADSIDPNGFFPRTTIITATFYHLQPESNYSVFFYGIDSPMDYYSYDTPTEEFDTPHGVRLSCEVDGTVLEQVEWEAVPDVEIRFASDNSTASMAGLDPADEAGFLIVETASDFQTDQWPADEYFHFDTNDDNYPKFAGFEGFPKQMLLYFDDFTNGIDDNTTDTCIRGLALVFESRNGEDLDPIWLAGSQSGFNAAIPGGDPDFDSQYTIQIDAPVRMVTGGIDNVGDTECLSAIRLLYDSDQTSCYGPAPGVVSCPTTLLAEIEGYYIYSFTVESTLDDYIVGLQADYAFVDIPTVQSSSTCVLDEHINYYWLRNSAWTKEIDLVDNFTSCAITKGIYYDHDLVPLQEIFGLDQNDIDGHEIVYGQTLLREAEMNESPMTDDVGGLTIIRQNYWQVNLYCYYEAEATVDNTFSVEGEDEQYIAGTNEFDFELNIYHTNAFDDEYFAEPTMLVGEPVYMAVEMLNTEADQFYVTAFDCWATQTNTQSQDGVNYYTLTGEEGCLEDVTFQWVELNDQFRDGFLFEAFAWYDGSAATTETVYVHCRVEACLMDNDAECTAKDPDYVCGSRARRDTEENPMERTRRQSEKVEKIVSASTPFKVQKRDVSNLDIDRSEFSFEGSGSAQMAAGMFSMFATTMFFCLLVISYRIYKLRRNNYARLQDAQTTY